MVNRVLPEVHHNLLCLTHIEGQVVCTTPFSQLCHFLSVVRFIVVGSVESGVSHLDSLGFRSGEFAGQSSTVTPWSLNQLLVALAVCAGARSCWKIKSASP